MGLNIVPARGGRRLGGRSLLAAGLAALTACSCSPDESDFAPAAGQASHRASSAAPAASPRAPASAPFDVAAVVRRVSLSFRPQGGGFDGATASQEVRVERGQIALRAVAPARDRDHRPLRSAQLQLETVALGQGLDTGAATTGQARLTDDGQLTVDRGLAQEQLTNREEGLEQSWRLAARPRGRGDLVVRVRVSGQRYAGQTASGHHFRDPATDLGFRYSHGVWIDAAGRRVEVPVRYSDGELVLRVPEVELQRAAYPAVLDPTVSAEVELDTPILSPAGDRQDSPAVASDGTNYLVIWLDRRGGSTALYGTRVTASGTVQDPYGILISSSAYNLSLAYGSSSYLVVWDGGGSSAIYGARVTPAGVVQDSTPITITTATGAYNPAVAYGGSQFLVAWEDSRGTTGKDIYASRVSVSGTVLDPSGVAVSTSAENQSEPAVASSGSGFLVAWRDYRSDTYGDIYAARVTSAGAVQDSGGIGICTVSGVAQKPQVSYGGGDYFVVWQDSRNSSVYRIYGSRVSTAGVVRDASGVIIYSGGS